LFIQSHLGGANDEKVHLFIYSFIHLFIYLVTCVLLLFTSTELFPQHIPPGHDEQHNINSCCAGYAMARTFGKTWNSPDCPASKINIEKIAPGTAALYFYELSFSYPTQAEDIITFNNDAHYVYVVTGGTSSTSTMVDFVAYCGANVETKNKPLSLVINGGGSIAAWGNPTGILRKKPVWSAKFLNSFGSGKIKLDGMEYNTGHQLDSLYWDDSVNADAVEDGEKHGGFTQRFQRWEDSNGNTISTEPAASLPIIHRITGPTNAEVFTAKFLKEYEISFENVFVGLSNSGIMKIDNVQYTLPTNFFPVLEINTILAEALNGQVFSGIRYDFDHWGDGSATRSKTFSPTGDWTYKATFIGKPLQVQRVHDIGAVGQPIKLEWNIHPNANCSYQVWRKVKNVSGPTQIATVAHNVTTYTDPLYSKTATYSDDLISYDVRAFYSIENTTADPSWYTVYGNIFFKQDDSTAVDSFYRFNPVVENNLFNFPNPFNPSTTIQYILPETGHVRISVYDARGSLVNTLLNQNQGAGTQTVVWDGTTEAGNPAVSGVYWVHLQSQGVTQTHKVMLIR